MPGICNAGDLDICISDHNVQFIDIVAQYKGKSYFNIRSIGSLKLRNFKVNSELDNWQTIMVDEKVNKTILSKYLINSLA